MFHIYIPSYKCAVTSRSRRKATGNGIARAKKSIEHMVFFLLQVDGQSTASSHTVPEEKVAVVSQAIREALQAKSAAAYLRPIVTSHAITANLQGALAAIKEAKEAQLLHSSSGTAQCHLTAIAAEAES